MWACFIVLPLLSIFSALGLLLIFVCIFSYTEQDTIACSSRVALLFVIAALVAIYFFIEPDFMVFFVLAGVVFYFSYLGIRNSPLMTYEQSNYSHTGENANDGNAFNAPLGTVEAFHGLPYPSCSTRF
jgi:hypothetical protein